MTVVVASSLDRAQETAAPIASAHGLPITTDDRVIEAGNYFEGKTFGVGDGSLRNPRHWPQLVNPFKPSWGEPYEEIADRMLAAIADARVAARGHEAVDRQPPAAGLDRCAPSSRASRLWHDPRKRQCSLASLTSLTFPGDELESITYSEPAAALLRPRPSKTAARDRWFPAGARGALVAACALGLSLLRAACTADANSVAAQAMSGDGKGFVSGDGNIERVAAADRGAAVSLGGTTLDGQAWTAPTPGTKSWSLNVWGSWCAPCVAETPHLQQAWQSCPPPGNRCSSWGSTTATAPRRRRASSGPTTSPTPPSRTTEGVTLLALQGKAATTPTTLVLDRQGRIAARVLGAVTDCTFSGLVDDVLARGLRP